MKVQIYILLMMVFPITLAQQNAKAELSKACVFSRKALEAAQRSADHLRFFQGAFDNTEIKEYLLYAREDLDSTYFYVKNSSYECADAAYFAKKNSNEKIAKRVLLEEKQLKTVAAKLDKIIKKIDEYVVHDIYNRDTYIIQFIQNFNETHKQLGQADHHLQQTHMMLENKPVN
ncbi:hypothetical protein [uncultured Sunxiuqinia sp.]|uniref:hypothetical protein n=1 Tax=uncultured Sunxiuqinia sp. TaxID=1573825 RepID=UPI002AA9345B|nr:hypothetical protein [uncultured Sunxiuqinia sp.]